MGKKVQVTEKIKASLRNALGDPEANPADYAIFEAKFLSTEPLTKKGFFNKARISALTLNQMAEKLKAEGSAVPLHAMHNDYTLPLGKVISAQVLQMANGQTELRGHFAITNEEIKLVNDIEKSIIDEVSVGLLTKEANCSMCGFNYFGDDTAAMVARMDRTCPDGHCLGEDGVHLNMNGMDNWSELSLVGKGAASNAKIMARAKQSLGQTTLDRLAASGTPAEAFILTASYSMEDNSKTNTGDTLMDTEKLVAQLTTASSELATTKLQLSQSTEAANALTAQVADLKTKLDAANTALGAEKETLQTKLTAAEKELADAYEKLMPHAKAALVASGAAETELPKTMTALLSMIEAKGLKLHQVFGADPKASGKDDPTKLSASESLRKESFKLSNKS